MVRHARRAARRGFVAALTVAAVLSMPASALAVLAGENGRIVLTSGRDFSDAQAQLHLRTVISSTGGGTLSEAVTSGGPQHRHPTWSPDRTKIAYARGDPATGNFDIFVKDLTSLLSPPVNITNSNNVTDDRPAWSPDGTRIAYESEVTDGSGQRDILIQPATGGAVTNFTNTTAAGQFEGKPAWSPDSAILYYELGNAQAMTNVNIMRRPVAAGAATLAVADSGISEFQPSISPGGSQICFTLSNNGFNNTADVLVAPITTPPSGGVLVSKDLAAADYNCTFSPDGRFVAYVTGAFGQGDLVMVRADSTSTFPIPLVGTVGRFDGNPDWAPDGRPLCPDVDVSTTLNVPVTFTITCTDTGPAYERTEVRESKRTDPANGSLTQQFAGDPFTYTPNPGFTGTDTFDVRSFDEFGFGDDFGRVTITVEAPAGSGPPPPPARCGGRPATIVGTVGNDTLVGTPRDDVIAGFGGADTIRGRGGNDLVCGGAGRDAIRGGGGNDLLRGQGGNDTVRGGGGRDRLLGGAGRDRLFGGRGNDVLAGGPGPDGLHGGAATDSCAGGRGTDRGRSCERRKSIP